MVHRVLALAMILALLSQAAAQSPITGIAFSPDERHIVCTSQQGVEVFLYPDLQFHSTFQLPWPNAHDVIFSSDNDQCIVAGGAPSELGGMAVLDLAIGEWKQRHDWHDDVAYRAARTNDGQWLATGSADHSIALLHTADELQRQLLGHSQPVTALTFAGAEHLVSGSVDASLRVWRLTDGQLLRTFENHTAAVTDLAQRPGHDAEPLVVASAGEDKTVRIWQPLVGRLVRFARLPSVPQCLAWTADGERIVVGCRDGHVRVIQPTTVTVVQDQAALGGWINALAVRKDGQEVLVGGEGGKPVRVALQ